MWNEMVKDEEITFNSEESAHPGMTPSWHVQIKCVFPSESAKMLWVSMTRGLFYHLKVSNNKINFYLIGYIYYNFFFVDFLEFC